MMDAHQARSISGAAGNWQVEGMPISLEGTPMILSIADGGRVLANSMRTYGKPSVQIRALASLCLRRDCPDNDKACCAHVSVHIDSSARIG
ncbi:MAG: hypothetical protein ACKPKO_56090, partial [Candidatus Fonsibacter sp.]